MNKVETSAKAMLRNKQTLPNLFKCSKKKDAQKEKRIAELQSLLDDAFSELSMLCNQVRDLEKSLEFTQKEQEEVKERIQTCEEEQIKQETN